jgi:hypothetical protein
MKKTIFIATLLPFLALAASKADAKPKPTPSPTTTITPTNTPTPSPRWVPPPPMDDTAKWINYRVATAFQNDASGSNFYSFVDLFLRRRLDQYNFTAEGDVRVLKYFSNSYEADSLQIITGDVSYSDLFLTAAAGRLNVGDPLTPMRFFGDYSTMGLRRLDGFQLTLPINFSVGVVDSGQSINSNSTALSLYYFPTVFSSTYAAYDTTQSFILGQARVSTKFADIPVIARFNIGGCANNFYDYSITGGDLTYSGSLDFTLAHDYEFYAEYGVEDAHFSNDSSVLGVGARARRLITFGPFSLDELILEMQVPISYSLNNTFTGGNNLDQGLASYPQKVFFVGLKTRIKGFNINFYITDSPGDYTFSRLNSSNALGPINRQPLAQPIGPGNVIDGLNIPLVASAYNTLGYLVDMEVTF